MRIIFIHIFLTIISITPLHAIQDSQRITAYNPVSLLGRYQGHHYLAIRRFNQGGVAYFLAYDLRTKHTKRIEVASWLPGVPSSAQPTLPTSDATTWVPQNALVLTMDLCPSPKPLDKDIITKIPTWIPRPVPIGIAVSGSWITKHPEDLEWLKEQEAQGHLTITWINHSDTHPYKPNVPYDHTFLLTPGLHVRDEILQTEIKMLEHGLVPSLFFRCPGLISNATILDELHHLHLMHVGATAWLAKGQDARPGRIILVHGNGNEPKGVQLLLGWYVTLTPSSYTRWISLEPLIPR